MRNLILESALRYAGRGWHVFPTRNKVPVTKHGSKDATTDAGQIMRWFAHHRNCQISIATGDRSRLFAIDLDNKNGANGVQSFIERYGEIPQTLRQLTPHSGLHLLFAHSPTSGFDPRTTKDRLGEGIETKGNGGAIVAAPSEGYRWDTAIKKLLPVPPQIIRDLAPQPHTCRPPKGRPFNESAYAEKTLGAIIEDMEKTSEGGRNTKLNALAYRLGRLISQGRMPEWGMQALLEAAIATGLDKTQAERTMQSGYAAGLKKG